MTSSSTSSPISGQATNITTSSLALSTTNRTTGITTSQFRTPSGTVPGTVVVESPFPTFSCDPYAYLILSSALIRIDILSGNYTQLNPSIGDGRSTNAIGYNIIDNYIYGAIGEAPTSNLIKISSNTTSIIGPPLNVSQSLKIGDVDNRGQYWGLASTTGNTYWVKIDLQPLSANYTKTILSGSSPLNYTIFDWAYSPGGGNALWSIGTKSSFLGATLLRFDLDNQTWSTSTFYGRLGPTSDVFGALYTAEGGYLYGSENNSGYIFKFPLPGYGTVATKISEGPKSGSNDGARCYNQAYGYKAKPR
ncbi:hypothetical protein VSDG_05286 [Cytospora chrysosperma]|uniref:DUF6923 domain-containing protein n=1 Tax=Cytospora chrysosperma TaxID=252740 RepID=A0A423VXA3_CYTCH|nr:hypothetical protein VSDG_05286 [Valsa sordida]